MKDLRNPAVRAELCMASRFARYRQLSLLGARYSEGLRHSDICLIQILEALIYASEGDFEYCTTAVYNPPWLTLTTFSYLLIPPPSSPKTRRNCLHVVSPATIADCPFMTQFQEKIVALTHFRTNSSQPSPPKFCGRRLCSLCRPPSSDALIYHRPLVLLSTGHVYYKNSSSPNFFLLSFLPPFLIALFSSNSWSYPPLHPMSTRSHVIVVMLLSSSTSSNHQGLQLLMSTSSPSSR